MYAYYDQVDDRKKSKQKPGAKRYRFAPGSVLKGKDEPEDWQKGHPDYGGMFPHLCAQRIGSEDGEGGGKSPQRSEYGVESENPCPWMTTANPGVSGDEQIEQSDE